MWYVLVFIILQFSNSLCVLDAYVFVIPYMQVDELQNTIEEEQKSMMEEMRMAIYENKNIVEDATVSVTGGSSETPMAID